MAKKKTIGAIRKVVAQLDYPGGSPPYHGRERHVIIAELAKGGLRLIGWDWNPDTWLAKRYKMTNVRQVALPGKMRMFKVWVGRPTTVGGQKELDRLIKAMLPRIPKETLPRSIARIYVR